MNGIRETSPREIGATVLTYLRSCVRIDTRSLALFRIALGLLIIADVILRSRNFWIFYSDDGVVPQALAQESTPEYAVSFFYLTSDPTWLGLLFVLHVLFAFQLIVGYKTRLATIISFLFVISLDHHNPFVLSYADTLFRLLFFWAIFLPLGERWSIDAVHSHSPQRPYFVGIASALALGQMVFMYSLNGIHKYPSELWQSGEAAILVMGIDEMTFLLGDFMRNFEIPLQIGGWLWFHMLLASPLLILLRGRKRLPLLFLFFGGHASFAITVRIGAFAYVAMAGLLLFLPPVFFQDTKRLLIRLEIGLPEYTAVRERLTTSARRIPNPRIQREGIDRIRNLGYRASMIIIVISLAICLVVVLPDITLLMEEDITHDQHPDHLLQDSTVASPIYEVADSFGVTQPAWSIFAGPDPRTTDRYYVFPAETADGELIDIYNERNLTFDRPGQELQKQHDTYRWRFYMNTIRRAGAVGEQPVVFAEYLCEKWETDHGTELVYINMYEITEEITRDTIDAPEERIRNVSLRSVHSCGEADAERISAPDW